MKLFQIVQKNLKNLGFIRNQGGHHLLRMQYMKATTIYVLGIISIFTFICSADGPGEYMDSFYILASTITIFISYMSFFFRMEKLFDFFDICEIICNMITFKFIQVSECSKKHYLCLCVLSKNQEIATRKKNWVKPIN